MTSSTVQHPKTPTTAGSNPLHEVAMATRLWSCGQNSVLLFDSLTESVGVERQTLELQEVSDGGRKNLDLVPRQIHRPQVTGESLQLLWKLKHTREEISD